MTSILYTPHRESSSYPPPPDPPSLHDYGVSFGTMTLGQYWGARHPRRRTVQCCPI